MKVHKPERANYSASVRKLLIFHGESCTDTHGRGMGRARGEVFSARGQLEWRSGEPVNLSGLAISQMAQTFPSRTVIAVTRGIISA